VDFERLGGVVVGAPLAVAWGPNRLDLFVRGTDGGVYHKAWKGTQWFPSPTDWEPLGGRLIDSPFAVTWGLNRLDVFGEDGTGQLLHRFWDGTGWKPAQGWETLGGPINI
jgi:hypothetical protein